MRENIQLDGLYYEYEIYDNGVIRNTTLNQKTKVSYRKCSPEINPTVHLTTERKTRLPLTVEELVMMHFHKDYQKGKPIYHIDGNKYHCEYENLTYEKPTKDPIHYLKEVLHDADNWRKIEGLIHQYEYEYYISNTGRIFNGTKYCYEPCYTNEKSGYRRGWEMVNLYLTRTKSVPTYVADLVVEQFLPDLLGGEVYGIIFEDKNPRNCKLTNIRLVNMMEARRYYDKNSGFQYAFHDMLSTERS